MTLTEDLSIFHDAGLGDLGRLYYRAVPAGDPAAGEIELVRAHRELAEVREPGTPVISTVERAAGGSRRSSPATVIQVVTDDMPCLVDSVLDELARSGTRVRRVVHPIVVVRRDAEGTLTEILADADPERPPSGALVESWMSIEVDQLRGEGRAGELCKRLTSVLDDVREVVRAGEEMRDIALAVGAAVEDADAAALLRWLANGHFMFLGYRFDDFTPTADPVLGLGLLRGDSSLVAGLDTPAPEKGAPLLELAPASGLSTVHGPGTPFHIGVRTFHPDGHVTGVHRFVGAFTSAAKHENVTAIPVVSERVLQAIHQAGVPLESHSGRRMLGILHDLPRTELFSADWEFLHGVVTGVPAPAERHRIALFVRRDPHGRFYSCLVYLPRDRFTTASRLAMEKVLLSELGGTSVDHYVRAGEAALATVQFIVNTGAVRVAEPDVQRLTEKISATVRGWDDHLVEKVLAGNDIEVSAELAQRYAAAFPEAYKEDFGAEVGLADLTKLRKLSGDGDLALSVYVPSGAEAGEARFKLYLCGGRITLSAVLPVLDRMGVEVVDEHPYEVSWDGTQRWIFDFGLAHEQAGVWRDAAARDRFSEAFAAVWRGDAEADRFNALVLCADLDWRQAALLRAYAKYLRQIGTTYSESYLQDTLLAHPEVATALVSLFETRFAPCSEADERERRTAELDATITGLVDEVTSLDADRILRGYHSLIHATVRTNYFYFVGKANPAGKDHVLSLKLNSAAVPTMPQPRPHCEIFVYSPRVEGVHLRYGPVARGGLRWSDRREDFRTEILGLVKAQAAKNAVIVPVGAKGGFVVKRPPGEDRNALVAEAVSCYRMFISGLLDVTDNLVDGRVVTPPRVVRHDDEDAYLVVAADKGTATFSDYANEVATAYGFWLGDAFASGGSVGYDHKAMGITARGAWESVKRHFRELGVDTQSQDFTVVGIGDMSGDVFGNGMLLSRHIRLVAAFDHRHVFVDPDPDPKVSFAERQRLFGLPRSSWADYDPAKISAGGGVWPRTAKSIPVSAPMRAALGLADGTEALSPAELIQAILRAPADLLWNGGIGTYVKSAAEHQTDAHDKANDAVRVNGGDLRVKVVGEGGNLGLTQLGRIEFARAGGKINTDALDNSAGVDCSDHEVNIKILLDQVVAKGGLSRADRDKRLAALTGEVAEAVLANNWRQNRVLGVSRAHAAAMVLVHARMIQYLERHRGLDRRLEALPSKQELVALERAGQGLTSPELATLMAHVKLGLKEEVLRCGLVEESAFSHRVADYFPAPLRKRYAAAIEQHPLRREIEATLLVNEVVDNGGLSYAFRLAEELSVEPADAVRAFAVVTEVFDLRSLWDQIDREGEALPTTVTDALTLETRRLLDRASRWMLTQRPQPLDVAAETERFRPLVRRLQAEAMDLVRGEEKRAVGHQAERLMADGVSEPLARRVACLLATYPLLDVVEIAKAAEGDDATESASRRAAELYYTLADHLGADTLLTEVSELRRDDRWNALARLVLRDDLYNSLRAVTLDVFLGSDAGDGAEDTIDVWEEVNKSRLTRARLVLDELSRSGRADLPALTVAVDQIRSMVG
ncbi:NAD-glutamate dehydrogenase [Amycolatopsis pigmentata]|uniref:NAD-glutamate dehydrogenase n=1 Tax=Amycolatopsis pigmentata TaxID=450801 RepID=A0ABW5G0V8_9PSEU